MTIDVFFIGPRKKPFYMAEIHRKIKKIIIYEPDRYSLKSKDFCEQYFLGDVVYDMEYSKIIYMKNDLKEYSELFETDLDGSCILSEMVIQTKNRFFLVKNSIYVSK